MRLLAAFIVLGSLIATACTSSDQAADQIERPSAPVSSSSSDEGEGESDSQQDESSPTAVQGTKLLALSTGTEVLTAGIFDEGRDTMQSQAMVTLPDGSALIAGRLRGTVWFSDSDLAAPNPRGPEDFDLHVSKGHVDSGWEWIAAAESNDSVTVFDIDAFADGSSIIVGGFQGQLRFGEHTITSAFNLYDAFVAKVSSTGEWMWASNIDGAGVGLGVAALDDGSAIVTGHVSSSGHNLFGSIYDYGPYGSGLKRAFVARISTSGDWLWARDWMLDAQGNAIADANDGTVIITGEAYQELSLSNEGGVTEGWGVDVPFIAKIDHSGTWLWTHYLPPSSETGVGAGTGNLVEPFEDGSALIGGWEEGLLDLPPEVIRTSDDAYSGGFIGKISASGEWEWANRAFVTAAVTLPGNSAILFGDFHSNLFDGTDLSLPPDTETFFAAGVDLLGEWTWLSTFDRLGVPYVNGIGIGPDNSVILSGAADGTFQIGTSETALEAGDCCGLFIASAEFKPGDE